MVLTEIEKDWTKKAIEKGFTKLQLKKKLQDNKTPNEKILEIYDYYDEIEKEYIISKSENELKEDKEKEIQFKDNVKKFVEGKEKELSWSEKREIKKFLKNITKYNETLKATIKMIKEEMNKMRIKFNDEKILKQEEELLRRDIIDRLIDSKEVIDVQHPVTGEDITKENLKELPLDILIIILEDNVETLQMVVNGKIE